MAAEHKRIYGIAAEFASAKALFEAAEKVRDEGFKRWDVHTPFPVHGMDQAMGLGKSWLSGVVLVGGITGLFTGVALTMYPSLVEYKTVVNAKPTDVFSIPAFMPIIFELTVLISAFACFFGMLIFNQLPRWYHPMFNWDRFERVSDNGFFMVIEARDPRFSEKRTRELLEKIGGTHVTLVED